MNVTTTKAQLHVFWPTELQDACRTVLGGREVGGTFFNGVLEFFFLNFPKITMVNFNLLYLKRFSPAQDK